MFALIKRLLLDGNKESFGRTFAVPFLAGAFLGLAAATVAHLIRGEGVIEECVTLATIGFSLYSGSKYLSIKGSQVQVSTIPTQEGEGAA